MPAGPFTRNTCRDPSSAATASTAGSTSRPRPAGAERATAMSGTPATTAGVPMCMSTEGNDPFPLGTKSPADAIGRHCSPTRRPGAISASPRRALEQALVEGADVGDALPDRREQVVVRQPLRAASSSSSATPQLVGRALHAVEAGEGAADRGVAVLANVLDDLSDAAIELRVEDLRGRALEQPAALVWREFDEPADGECRPRQANSRDDGGDRAVRDERLDGLDVGRRRPILVERRDPLPHERVNASRAGARLAGHEVEPPARRRAPRSRRTVSARSSASSASSARGHPHADVILLVVGGRNRCRPRPGARARVAPPRAPPPCTGRPCSRSSCPASGLRKAGSPALSEGESRRNVRRSEIDARSASASRSVSKREREALPVEVARGHHLGRIVEDDRVVRDGVQVGLDEAADEPDRLAGRAVHLGNAAERVGVLDVPLAGAHALGSRDERADDARPTAPGPAAAGARGRERRTRRRPRGALRARARPRRRQRRACGSLGCEASAPIPAMKCVPLTSASASFGASSIGLDAGGRERLRRRTASVARRAPRPSPISGRNACADGARSPLAPSEPVRGTRGTTPAFRSPASALGDERADA